MIPRYSELPFVEGTTERHAWDVWGRKDQLGSMNRLQPAQIATAAASVKEGLVVPLALPLGEPDPGIFPRRTPFEHVVERGRTGRDDRLDNLHLQFSSQWDGLRHITFRGHGYWGGRTEDDLDTTRDIGIDHWASVGPIGRGVLIDVAAHLHKQGKSIDQRSRFEITPELIDEVATEQGTTFRDGDFWILRTGWMEWYLTLDLEERQAMRGEVGKSLHCPGLESSCAMAEMLWDRGAVAAAADNISVEAMPVLKEKGFLHHRLIPLLGMGLGEFWYLKDLADACAALGRWEFLLSAGVLRVPCAAGSPAVAHAIL